MYYLELSTRTDFGEGWWKLLQRRICITMQHWMVKVKVKVGKSLHKLHFPVLTSSFRPLFDLPDAPSAVPPTSSEWVPGRPVPKPWRFY